MLVIGSRARRQYILKLSWCDESYEGTQILFWVHVVREDLIIWSVANLDVPALHRWQGGRLDPDKSVAAVCGVDNTSQNQITSISKVNIGARWKNLCTYKDPGHDNVTLESEIS